MINLVACSTITATTSFRDGFDFSSIESYSTYGRNSTFGDLQNLSDSTRNNIELAIEQGFDGNGFSYKTLKKADIVIAYHLLDHRAFELEKYNREVKYCGYCLRAGQATHAELENKLRPGSLILDIIDPKSQRSVWRSVYPLKFKADDYSRETQEKITTAVDSMLRDFPQGKKSKVSANSSKEPA